VELGERDKEGSSAGSKAAVSENNMGLPGRRVLAFRGPLW
jgi:hypothetical protein